LATKLPAQLFVTGKRQPIYENGIVTGYNTTLGFLNAYEPGKTSFAKKQVTQMDWAYQEYIHNFRMEQRGNEWWITGEEWEPWTPTSGSNRTKLPVLRLADPQPAVWDNTPIPGFKVLRSVSRYSTSNKLWRIMDPRGLELEISTGCMEQIIDDATIIKGGLIDANCAWMANKNLVVVP
jgi:hypothetical protein